MQLFGAELLNEKLFGFALSFCRIGSFIMLLPGIGEIYVSARIRLVFALFLSFICYLSINENIGKMPDSSSLLFLSLFHEIVIGIFLGTVVRILIATMHTMGIIVSMQSGLSMAMMFDPTQNAQGAVVGNFMTSLVMAFIFISDTHHLFIRAFVNSFDIIKINHPIIIGEFTNYIVKTVGSSFDVGVKLAAPQILVSLLVVIASGLLARVFPVLQVFFLITPLQLIISFTILMITISILVTWFMQYFTEYLGSFLF